MRTPEQNRRIILRCVPGAFCHFTLTTLADVAWFVRARRLSVRLLLINDRVLSWVLGE